MKRKIKVQFAKEIFFGDPDEKPDFFGETNLPLIFPILLALSPLIIIVGFKLIFPEAKL